MNPAPSRNATTLIADLASNPVLLEKVGVAQNDPEALRELLAGEGYYFTREEWEAAMPRKGEALLSDAALNDIAGGWCRTNPEVPGKIEALSMLWNKICSIF